LESVKDFLRKLKAIALLQMAKRNYTYKELSTRLNLDTPTLNRYVNRQILPTNKRAQKIIQTLQNFLNPSIEIVKCLFSESVEELPEADKIFTSHPELAMWIISEIFDRVSRKSFDSILTVEGGGYLFASCISAITGKRVVLARKRKPHGSNYIFETYYPHTLLKAGVFNPDFQRNLFLPRYLIRRKDRVILMDDVIWTGETMRALFKMATRVGMNVNYGIVIAVWSKDVFETLQKDLAIHIDYLIPLYKYRKYNKILEVQEG